MTGGLLFTTVPGLPVVPLPAKGEALNSWIWAIARTYGLMPKTYLRRLGIPHRWLTKAIEQDLVIQPLPSVMERLQADTGMAPDVVWGMTFFGLDRELEDACRRHHAPCAACVNEASERAGRPVGLLHARAAWRIVCPDHLPTPKPMEMADSLPLVPFHGQVRTIIRFLDRAAFDPRAFEGIVGTRMAPAFTVTVFLRFVFLLNAYLSVQITEFDELRDWAGFRIRRTFTRNEAGEPLPLPPEEGNDPAISLVLAWQLVAAPIRTLLAGLHTVNPVHRKTARDTGQLIALACLLLEFWPGEMLTPLLTRLALSRQDWNGDGDRTGLAIATTAPWSNDPSHSARLAEAHWTHTAWTRVLFSDAIRNHHTRRVSRFPAAGPFRWRFLAANGQAAPLIGEIRREARQSGRKKPASLGLFLAKPVPATREAHAAPPQPVSVPAIPTHIA
ncbi:MAG: TniQ family protein [Magnetospirillum sp.]|nr:TniQ family protein [Magnetospirillum sp.]